MKKASLIIGLLVAGLGIAGLLGGEGRIANSMNINIMLDSARILLGGILIASGLISTNASKTALLFFGIAYLGMFLAGIVSPQLFGMAPDGIGWMDQTLHLGGGLLSLALPFLLEPSRKGRLAI